MKRYTCILILLILTFSGCKTEGDKNIVGSWEIIEFHVMNNKVNSLSDEAKLRNAGAVWDMEFSRNGDFKQTFNMRNRNMKMETEEGSWKVSNDSLIIEVGIDMVMTKLEYDYKINDDVLVLTLDPPDSETKIITKFREK